MAPAATAARRGTAPTEAALSGPPTSAHAPLDRPLVDRTAAAALALLAGVGPIRWRALMVRHEGDGARAAAAYGASPAAWSDALRAAARLLDPRPDGIGALVPGDPDYPRALLDLPDTPPLLWLRGRPEALAATPAVAIVGTRHNTAAGAHTTRRLVAALHAALGDAGACVVSGLARGIDGAAHEAALAAGLPTVAVLGTAVDTPYPAQHRALYARVVEAGAVVSEQAPGTPAAPGAFPRRNRVIAALATCTVVVEAGERSGALITADFANDLGRTVAAVPGPIDAPASAGTNVLLRDGAHVLASVDDLIPLLLGPSSAPHPPPHPRPLHPPPPHPQPLHPRPTPTLDGDELTLWTALAEPALDSDTAATRANLPARRCAAALAGLELRGVIETDLTGTIRRL